MERINMKKAKYNFEEPDLSRYHILTYDELLKVNGGSGNDSGDDEAVESESEETSDEGAETATESTPSEEGAGEPSADPMSESTSSGTDSESESGGHEIENTVEAVANAEVGDTLTRDDGTQVTITQGDIDWAQEHCDSYGKGNSEEEKEESPAKESDLPSAEDANCSKTEQEEGGSRRIENTDEAVANAKPGDTLVRDDGTVVTLKEVDIEQAQEKLGINGEKNSSKEGELAEKSSGENKNTKGENAAEERAYINSKLDTPKGNNTKIIEEKFVTFDVNFEPVKDKYGNFLGYGVEALERKEALEKAPQLNVSFYGSGSVGLAQGNLGFTVTHDYYGQTSSFIKGMDVGVYTPGVGFNISAGLSFPKNEGVQSHTMGLSIFGFSGDITFSENGITGFNVGISSNPGYKSNIDLNDFGTGYNLIN